MLHQLREEIHDNVLFITSINVISGVLRRLRFNVPSFEATTSTNRIRLLSIPKRAAKLDTIASLKKSSMLTSVLVVPMRSWIEAEKVKEKGVRVSSSSYKHDVYRIYTAIGSRGFQSRLKYVVIYYVLKTMFAYKSME